MIRGPPRATRTDTLVPYTTLVRSRRVTGPLAGGPNVENGMDRAQKTEAVAELNRTFNEVGVVVVTRNLGLTVAQSTELRIKMREAGATYKVSKNKLAKIALKDTDYAGLSDLLTGPVGLATSSDQIGRAHVCTPVTNAHIVCRLLLEKK